MLVIGSDKVGDALAHPRVVAATLTGSGAAGAAVAPRAGSLLKKTVLELGGSDPYLVLDDADLDLAADVCAASRLINGGQSCIAAKRFIVVDSVYEPFVARLAAAMSARKMGDPLDEDTDIGPQARVDLRDDLHRQVTASIAAGAELVMGGEVPPGPGAFYPATILKGVTRDMPIFNEETFGPVAAVTPVPDEEAAIAPPTTAITGSVPRCSPGTSIGGGVSPPPGSRRGVALSTPGSHRSAAPFRRDQAVRVRA